MYPNSMKTVDSQYISLTYGRKTTFTYGTKRTEKKKWYSDIKARPSFQSALYDRAWRPSSVVTTEESRHEYSANKGTIYLSMEKQRFEILRDIS